MIVHVVKMKATLFARAASCAI